MQVMREKRNGPGEANGHLAEAHDRTLGVLDEVLTKSLERDKI